MKTIGRLLGAFTLIFTGMIIQECYHQRLDREKETE